MPLPHILALINLYINILCWVTNNQDSGKNKETLKNLTEKHTKEKQSCKNLSGQ